MFTERVPIWSRQALLYSLLGAGAAVCLAGLVVVAAVVVPRLVEMVIPPPLTAADIEAAQKVPMLYSDLRIGDRGILSSSARGTPTPVTLHVDQVVDRRNVRCSVRSRPGTPAARDFWIEMDTADLFDGKSFLADMPFEVKGNKSYETIIGMTMTIPHLVMLKPKK